MRKLNGKMFNESKQLIFYTWKCHTILIMPLKKDSQSAYVFYSDKINLKALDDNIVEGYISTSDPDLVNDIVTPDCMFDMLNQLKNRSIKIDVEHESFRGKGMELELNKTKIPISKITDGIVDSKGVLVKTVLNTHHRRFDEVKGSIKDGFLDAFSIAYIPVKYAYKTIDGVKKRLLQQVKLLNVAFTGIPVNTKATFTNVMLKSLQDGFEFDPDLTEAQIDQLIGGNKMAEEDAKKDPQTGDPAKTDPKSAEENIEAKALNEKFEAQTKSVSELKSLLEVEQKARVESEKKAAEFAEKTDKELKALKELLDSHEKVLSAPQFKAKAEQMKEVLSEVEKKAQEEKNKTSGPLDRIA